MPRGFIAIVLACCILMPEAIAQQTGATDGWDSVASRSVGEMLKIKRKDGSAVNGKFKSASDAGLVLELKNKELSLRREEIESVAVLSRKSAGKATVIGLAVGGGIGAGTGAGIAAAVFGSRGGICCPRGQSAAVGAGVGGTVGALAGGLVGFVSGHSGRKETIVYQSVPAK